MIGAWYDDGWAEDLASWEELTDLLRDDWDRVDCPSLGLSLERADGLLAFDVHRRWQARHRRGLHRLGFRALALGGVAVWKWDVEPQLRTSSARDHLVHEQALRVLREVFRCQPGALAVLLVREEDEWWDEEDDAWPLPGR